MTSDECRMINQGIDVMKNLQDRTKQFALDVFKAIPRK